MKKMQDEIVFITGAYSGIGAACAEQFAELGAKIILTARNKARLEEFAEQLRVNYQVEVLVLPLDITNKKQIAESVEGLSESWREISVLVNNAGMAVGKELYQNSNLDDVDLMLKTNVSGLLYVTHAILPGMVARNKGHVINVGSTAGHHVYQAGLIYCMSKTAVKTISEGLKEDLQGTAVRVSEVDPGFVETDFHSRRYQGNEEKVAAMLGGFTPLKAEDVAEAIVFAATRPAHVNVMEIVLHSVDQTKQGHIFRKGE